jgi:acetyl esterase
MAVEPQTQQILDQLAALGGPPLHTMQVIEARRMMENLRALAAAGPEVGAVEDRRVPGPAGEIPVRLYRPAGDGPFPALVWFHGGGWVLGDLDGADATCRELANAAGCVVVSVDYRLAPESKFPAAADDCYAATRWVADNAAALHVDATRVAVGGDSAGGNLTAVTALRSRDLGAPALRFQLLVYPVTDATSESPSYAENGEGYLLTRDSMQWFWNHYLRGDTDRADPYASPLRAASLAGLPPALVITAEFDPLRDEGEAYGRRLRDAGVRATISRYPGTIHGFFSMTGFLDLARKAVAEASSALATHLR